MSNTTLSTLALAASFALLCSTGCADELDTELSELDDETQEIIDNLQLAGYPETEIEVIEDEVIVGGDAVVNLEASREMASEFADEHDEHFRQYSTNNEVSASVETICVNLTDLMASPILHIGAFQALGAYNNLNLSFSMVAVVDGQSTDHCDAVIDTRIKAGTSAKAGFPSDGMPYDDIQMGTGIAAYGVDVSRHVFMHELGHCVGLRHSDYFNRSLSCGKGGNEGGAGVGANLIPGTTPGFDPQSVMNSCYSTNSTGTWSIFDHIALLMLYQG